MRENVFLLKEIIRSLSMEGTDYRLLVHEDGAFGVSSIAVESKCSKHVLVMDARTLGQEVVISWTCCQGHHDVHCLMKHLWQF
jgi:hypothetical protein